MNKNIKIVEGDITQCPEGINVIMHQANTQNVMGAGVALALRNKWPKVFEADTRIHDRYKNIAANLKVSVPEYLLGRFSVTTWFPKDDGGLVRVFNLYGQHLNSASLAGHPTDYNAVFIGMKRVAVALKIITEREGVEIILGIPYLMGCGLAGGDWNIYSSIINTVFGNLPYKVVIVKFVA